MNLASRAIKKWRSEGFISLIRSAYFYTSKKIGEQLDESQRRFRPVQQIPVGALLTENRKDIQYRIEFLDEVFEDDLKPQDTSYYYFISDSDRYVVDDAETRSRRFISLFQDVIKNGIQEPLIVARYSTQYIPAKTVVDDKTCWSNIPNKTGYQLIDGAHRVAIATYLGYDVVPAKVIYRPTKFDVPNYTRFIDIKEEQYQELICNKCRDSIDQDYSTRESTDKK